MNASARTISSTGRSARSPLFAMRDPSARAVAPLAVQRRRHVAGRPNQVSIRAVAGQTAAADVDRWLPRRGSKPRNAAPLARCQIIDEAVPTPIGRGADHLARRIEILIQIEGPEARLNVRHAFQTRSDSGLHVCRDLLDCAAEVPRFAAAQTHGPAARCLSPRDPRRRSVTTASLSSTSPNSRLIGADADMQHGARRIRRHASTGARPAFRETAQASIRSRLHDFGGPKHGVKRPAFALARQSREGAGEFRDRCAPDSAAWRLVHSRSRRDSSLANRNDLVAQLGRPARATTNREMGLLARPRSAAAATRWPSASTVDRSADLECRLVTASTRHLRGVAGSERSPWRSRGARSP